MMAKSTAFLKDYYYDVIHWEIRLYIYQIRNNNYPLDYWKQSLIDVLKRRNEYVAIIKNNQEIKQLQLF